MQPIVPLHGYLHLTIKKVLFLGILNKKASCSLSCYQLREFWVKWKKEEVVISVAARSIQWWGTIKQLNKIVKSCCPFMLFVLQCPPLYPVLSTSWPCSSPTLIKLFLTKSGSIFCKLVTCWHLRVGPKSYYFAWKLMASTLIISLFHWTLLLWVMKWTKI